MTAPDVSATARNRRVVLVAGGLLALVAVVAIATTVTGPRPDEADAGAGGAAGAGLTQPIVSGPRAEEVNVAAGTTLVAAFEQTISTEGGEVGTPVRLATSEDVEVGDGFTIPAGSTLRGEVTHTQGGGRIAGAPELTIRFRELVVDGTGYDITAEPFRIVGKDDATERALEISGGAGAGAVIGASAGGGSGALKGAAAGAVIGTGVAVATKGDQIVLAEGQKLRIRLAEPVTLRLVRNVEAAPE